MLAPAEVESLVTELQPLGLQEAGTEPWDTQASTIERLSVCAVLQSGAGGTEQVARLLADEDRVTVVVQQLVALEVWRQELLPRLLQSGPPASSFPAYSILFQVNNGKITVLLPALCILVTKAFSQKEHLFCV